MKTPESTFPDGLLNREEISFLLRPADKSGLQTLARSRNAAGELFAGRLAAACSQRLAPLFFHPLSVAAEIGNFDEESSVGFVFSAGGRKIACRLTKADAALLAALALGNAPAAGRAGFRGISLAITRRLLKTLAETAAETLAENDEPKGKNAAFVPLPLCLQLDIRGRKTKIFLSFGCKETPPENNRRMDGAERLRQPLAVRRLNDGTDAAVFPAGKRNYSMEKRRLDSAALYACRPGTAVCRGHAGAESRRRPQRLPNRRQTDKQGKIT